MTCLQRFAIRWSLFYISLLAGCASFAPSIRSGDKLDRNSAYLYGRFFIEAPSKLLGHQSIGFVIKCRDGQKYTLGLSKRKPVQVIKIVPSSCSLTEIVFTAPDGTIERRRRSPASALKNSDFAPGVAYYLGDIDGEATFEWTPHAFSNEYQSQWGIKRIDDNYEATTKVVHRLFPSVATLPTEERMLFDQPE